MFHNLKIENFKCFPKHDITFRDLTILAGANASGKSSIIQAMLILEETAKVNIPGELNLLQNMGQILGIQVGAPSALVAQDVQGDSDCDFAFWLDGRKFGYYIDRDSVLNLGARMEREMPPHEMTYLNAERIGPRMLYEAGGKEKITANGSNAVYLMEQGDKMGVAVEGSLIFDRASLKFSHQVECWMQAILGELQLQVYIDTLKAQSELTIKNPIAHDSVIPTLTGFGISYVLPIVVSGLWCSSRKNQVLMIENPEAHLHPSAQSAMGQFLALVAGAGVQVIVETHSEHIVDGARLEMMYLEKTDQMLVNFLSCREGEIEITPLLVNNKGELDEWPAGFFDQKQRDLRKIFQQRMGNGNTK